MDSDALTGAATALRSAAGLLVDLDGTLIDSTAPARRAWHAFAARHGLDGEWVLQEAHGKPSRETVRRLAPAEAREREIAELERDEVQDTDGVVALAGAAELLDGAWVPPLALVTSCSRALAHARLAAAALIAPAVIVSADDVAAGKPDPEPFRRGAEALGLAPADCVVLEDAPAGITAGRAAGATVIALISTHPADELSEADWVVSSLAALVRAASR